MSRSDFGRVWAAKPGARLLAPVRAAGSNNDHISARACAMRTRHAHAANRNGKMVKMARSILAESALSRRESAILTRPAASATQPTFFSALGTAQTRTQAYRLRAATHRARVPPPPPLPPLASEGATTFV